MTWAWDMLCMALQPQPKYNGMVCTLASGRFSANSPKYGEMYVVVSILVGCNMPIHYLRKYSNNSYMYDMNMGCSLHGSTASIKL